MTLTKEDQKRLAGNCKKLMEHIERTNYAIIPYETLISIAGARGPARMHELAKGGLIAGYTPIRRRGGNTFDYQPLAATKSSATQLSLLSGGERQKRKLYEDF
jgi:hypothetical protein